MRMAAGWQQAPFVLALSKVPSPTLPPTGPLCLIPSSLKLLDEKDFDDTGPDGVRQPVTPRT